jgi:hypothetical protein
MKTYWGVEVHFLAVLTSALYAGERPLYSQGKAAGTIWVRGLMSFIASIDPVEKIENRPQFLGHPVCGLVTIPAEVSTIFVLITIDSR